MADTKQTKDIILNISVPYKDAINSIVQLQKQLDELAVEQMKVNAAFKNGEKTRQEADKELEAIAAQTRLLKQAQREYRKEIDANLQAEEANNGSLKQMRAELKNLIREYDNLSKADRESAIGDKKMQEINQLQDSLKQLEGATGRFQRNVGDYENAIRRALDGTVPMKQAMRELKTEIQTLEFQYRNQSTVIQEQERQLAELGQTIGTDTDEYRQQSAALEQLKKDYDTTGQELDKMKQAAGQMADAIGDSNEAIKNFGKDNANLKAATQAAGLLLDGYTALKAGMTALGIESEELMDVFAKLQILQQGLNAVNQIANMLEEQSLLRQQARVLWTKLTTQSITTMSAAKKRDAVASAEAAAGDAAMAAGETAATAAAGALTTALKAVGAAIKSIPLIGWLAAGVAAVAALTALVVKHVRAEREQNRVLTEREQIQKNINSLAVEASKTAEDNIAKLRAQINYLNSLEKGSKEWNAALGEVAATLGVTKKELGDNAEKLEEYAQAWITLQIIQAKSDILIQEVAKNQKNLIDYEQQIQEILEQQNKSDKEKTEELKKQYGFTEKIANKIVATYKENDKRKNGWLAWAWTDDAKNQTADNYLEALEEGRSYIEDSSAIIEEHLTDAYKDATELTNKYFKNTTTKANTTASAISKDVTTKYKQLSNELEDLMVEGMADGLEKQIAEVEKSAKRYIEKMKEAREKDLDNKEKYDEIILQYEKNTQDKIKKMRADGYKTIIANSEKLTEAYNKLWASYAPNSFYNFVNDLAATATKVSNEVNAINKEIRELEGLVAQYEKTRGAEGIFAKEQEALSNQLKEQLTDLKEPLPMPVKPELVFDKDAINTQWNKIVEKLYDDTSSENARLLADRWKQALKEIYKQFPDVDIEEKIHNFLGGIYTATEEGTERTRKTLQEAFNAILNDNVLDEFHKKLDQYTEDLEKYNKRVAENAKIKKDNANIQEQLTAAEEAAAAARKNEATATENLSNAKEKLAEAEKNYLSSLDESILKNRALNKSLREYAKTIQQVLLEQAKLGNIDIIPQDFQVYIDYQIDKLEEELAKAYRELEKLAPTAGDDNNEAYKLQRELYNRIAGQLQMMKEARDNVSKDMVTSSATGGFFDNTELIENEINIKRVANQIKTLQQVLEQGSDINGQIASAEEDNNYLYKQRITLLTQISEAVTEQAKAQKEAELEEIDSQIALNNETIANLKQSLALMGYTTEEEMQQLLDSLLKQQKAFADQTGVIMKRTAASVMQSISTMVDSLADLMNAIGDDNAEMANFLEGIAYIQIGVNMAAGISEAIAAGAGVPFPANLAAIATGVAAVMSGMASAISTYKQFHKQVSSPDFADGGIIGMRYAKTKAEGRRDDVPINASVGEYIVNAEAVKRYGVDFFDQINFGHSMPRRRTISFADGGVVDATMVSRAVASEESYQMLRDAMSEIQPVVSVREISNMQKRVKVAETVAMR